MRALTHSLTTQRLHHAWLFTGTRGVGKTTLSRLLAKSLNCEIGITATPCGVCRACTEIDEGRFVDYLELDAASNRGVDEMTQLLEQAVYSPGAGRFKVYMIDEVHMLTGHAFNAMLKTLEEPPPHVKFILATTDPQKIPVTVLSRCLQFNLKQMPGDAIVGHLQNVLGQEQIPFETPALRLLGQAASGSMRDALSLTDQAIAYSAGNLTEESVRGMLGTIDQRHLVRLLEALQSGQAGAVLEIADELAVRGLSYRAALADMAVMLSRIAIAQRVAQAIDEADPLGQDIARLAASMHHDAVQLFYTVAVHSRSELAIAPDEYAGFVMACLRMLSLHGATNMGARADVPPVLAAPAQTPPVISKLPAPPVPVPEAVAAIVPSTQTVASDILFDANALEEPEYLAMDDPDASSTPPEHVVRSAAVQSDIPVDAQPAVTQPAVLASGIVLPAPWAVFSAQLPVSGMAEQLARQSECIGVLGNTISLRVPTKALTEGLHADRLRVVLSEHFGVPVQLQYVVGAVQSQSAHTLDLAAQQALQQAAELDVENDPFVQALVNDFGGRVVPGSIRPSPVA